MKNELWAILAVLLAVACYSSAENAEKTTVVGLALTGQAAIEFLQTAEVVSDPEVFDDLAITSPRRMELSDGRQTLRVIFKDENTLYRDAFHYGDGRKVTMVKDSYLHEIAAFELDLLLGLELVAPCVERKLFKRKGSVCLWVGDSMSEVDRRELGLEPPDMKTWNRQMDMVRLFKQLISDQDFANNRNIVVDSNFRIYKADSSMAFYRKKALIDRLHPTKYPPRFLTALENLDPDEFDERLKPWLFKAQRKSVWERRDRILERARELVAEQGEDEVLY